MNRLSLCILYLLSPVILIIAGCSQPGLPNAITQNEASRAAAQSPAEAREVQFGRRFQLLGVVAKPGNSGVVFELAWQSLTKQRLDALVPVHVVDNDGKILAQADYRQRPEHRDVPKGSMW